MQLLNRTTLPNSIKQDQLYIDFNGHKSDMRQIKMLLKQIKDKRISYLEIAIDYRKEDLSENIWIDTGGRKGCHSYCKGNGHLESLYIGSRESSLQYVVYDKNAQMKLLDKEQWWRVEARIRPQKRNKQRQFCSVEKYIPDDLFSTLLGIPPYKNGASPELNALHVYYRCYPTEKAKLSRYLQKNLAKIDSRRKSFMQPRKIYEGELELLRKKLCKFIMD